MAIEDPAMAFRFEVEIDGIKAVRAVHVEGLESRIDVVEYRTGGESPGRVRKLAGRVHYPVVTVRYGVTSDDSIYLWHQDWVNDPSRAERKGVLIRLLDGGGTPVKVWVLREAWPSKWEGPVLNALGSGVAVETVELSHEGIGLAGG